MKNGDKAVCPHCGERTLVREKKCYDENFSLTGVRFFCSLCGGELKPEENGSTPQAARKQAADRLSQLLGGEKAAKVRLAPEADDGHFCLHCRHFIKHPFMNRCGVTMREVEATGSCAKFEAAE